MIVFKAVKPDHSNVLMLDFSNTITTVESEDLALRKYLEFVAETEGIRDEKLFERFSDLRSKKLVDREVNFRTFVKINHEVLIELYGIENIHEEEYYKFHERYLKLKNDFIPFIEEICNYVTVIMLTDADNIYTERTSIALGIKKYFDYIVTAENVGKPKPDIAIFNAAKSLSPKSKVFWHVGDSEKRDIEGAKKAGIFAVLMSDKPAKTKADASVRNFHDLEKLIKELNFLNY